MPYQNSHNKVLLPNTIPFLGGDATGDLYYRDSLGFLQRLPIGSTSQVLTVTAGLPQWQNAGAGTGTVTSVGLTMPGIFSVLNSPITSSNSFIVSLQTQSPNTFFAGPTGGLSSAPTFRSLVSTDIPSLDASILTSGLVGTARLASGTADSTTYFRGDQSWQPIATLGGTATGHLYKMTCANNGIDPVNDIDFYPGVAEVNGYIVSTNAITTKRLDAAWSAGNNNGGLFAGSKVNSTWYHCFVLRNTTTGAVDFGFDSNYTGSSKPSGWDARIIMSIWVESGGSIKAFSQYGDRVEWNTPVLDVNKAISASGELVALTVPPILQPQVFFTCYFTGTNSTYLYFTSPGQTNETADAANGRIHVQSNSIDQSFSLTLTPDVDRQIRVRSSGASTDNLKLLTLGFIHPRGKW